MSPSHHSFHLWIATDDTKTLVALAPVKVSGAQYKHEWGSITDLRAMPSPRQPTNVVGLVLLVLFVVLGILALCAFQAPLLVALFLAALALAVGAVLLLRKPLPSQAVAPELNRYRELHRVLDSAADRQEFRSLVELAERAGRTVPAFEGTIDPADAGQTLAQTLWEAADVLDQRTQLHAQALTEDRYANAAGDGPASRSAEYLAGQRERAKGTREQTNEELARIRTALEAAAVAGENASHDPEATGVVRDAYRELSDLHGRNL